mgnify:CR=1 FL=1
MSRVLIVEDELVIRGELKRVLARHGLEVSAVGDVAEALALGPTSFDLILTDLRLPGASGDTLIEHALGVPVIVMTAYATVHSAVDAMKRGAVDYLTKPFDPDELGLIVQRALRESRLRRQNAALQHDVARAWAVDGLIGECPAMRDVFQRIDKAAPTDAKVLILGESGTGKELVARALHARSPRRDEPFVAVNCAAIPEGLIESELFGHERGAFTGAVAASSGLVQAAHRGTLFLDEIGELPLPAQARLLRVLQENEVRRVGSSKTRTVDVRLVAATHRDLPAMVRAGALREDLYFRLRVIEIRLPPLRERGDDIVALARVLLDRLAAGLGRPGLQFSDDALAALRRHDWPGNVRELENAIERAIILHDGGPVDADLLGLAHVAAPPAGEPDPEDSQSMEAYFRGFVLRHQDSLGEAELARRLGISRKTLWERRQRLGLPRPGKK